MLSRALVFTLFFSRIQKTKLMLIHNAISLTSIDGINDEDGMKHSANIVKRNTTLVMLQVPLPFRRLWNYCNTVLAHGCHHVMNDTLLSN